MDIGILKEILPENRVSITPQVAKALIDLGFTVNIAKNAGINAGFTDIEYQNAGAKICSNDLAIKCDIVIKINTITTEEVDLLKENSYLICFINPQANPKLLEKLAHKNVQTFAMDCVPRLSSAQNLDALSSMANISGYRAIIEATNHYPSFIGGQITSAGKSKPAKILVLGAGVAGLAAIACAKNLGGDVYAYDPRSEVKDQIISLGGKFLAVNIKEDASDSTGYAKDMSLEYKKLEKELLIENIQDANIIITTAQIQGKKAPLLIDEKMLNLCPKNCIIVDLAASSGGNVSNSKANQIVEYKNCKIIGDSNLNFKMPYISSVFYANNVFNLIHLIHKEQQIQIDLDNDIVRNICLIYDRKIIYPAPKIQIKKNNNVDQQKTNVTKEEIKKPKNFAWIFILSYIGMIGISPKELLPSLNTLTLALILGYYIIWNVKPALHTPLMSATNAISGIVILGAFEQLNSNFVILYLALFTICITSINIFGGFAVTNRMLQMFNKKRKDNV